jgi:protein-L-isoaspartate(D-aspartate) O-methyltransferase
MVAEQLRARGVRDGRVLQVMEEVPRERFVDGPAHYVYDDRALPIGLGQTISQPYIVAVMTQALELARHHRVLEVGTGSGYQSAILARLAQEVWTIERQNHLSGQARAVLDQLGMTNIHFLVGDGTKGWPEAAPFDRIIVTAGSPDVPAPLREQLAVGGLMVLPVGPVDQQNLVQVTRQEGRWTETPILACRFVRLIGTHGWGEGKDAPNPDDEDA